MLLKDVFNPKLLYKGRVTGCIFPKYYIRQYDRNIIHVYHLLFQIVSSQLRNQNSE